MDLPEFSEDDSWSIYPADAQQKVGIALKNLVRAVADGLNLEWMVDRADHNQIADLITVQLQWLTSTDFLKRIIDTELGPGDIGTEESDSQDGADAG